LGEEVGATRRELGGDTGGERGGGSGDERGGGNGWERGGVDQPNEKLLNQRAGVVAENVTPQQGLSGYHFLALIGYGYAAFLRLRIRIIFISQDQNQIITS